MLCINMVSPLTSPYQDLSILMLDIFLGGDIENGLSGLYAGHHGPRPEPSSSASPPTGGVNAAHFAGFPPHSTPSMLVVPQPINASKVCFILVIKIKLRCLSIRLSLRNKTSLLLVL